MPNSGQKIIDGLKHAIAGNFARVTIDGQTWERVTQPVSADERIAEALATNIAAAGPYILRPNELLPAAELIRTGKAEVWEGYQGAIFIGLVGQDRKGSR